MEIRQKLSSKDEDKNDQVPTYLLFDLNTILNYARTHSTQVPIPVVKFNEKYVHVSHTTLRMQPPEIRTSSIYSGPSGCHVTIASFVTYYGVLSLGCTKFQHENRGAYGERYVRSAGRCATGPAAPAPCVEHRTWRVHTRAICGAETWTVDVDRGRTQRARACAAICVVHTTDTDSLGYTYLGNIA